MDKNKTEEKIPWLKSKKTGPKKKKVFDEGWRKTLAETDKGSWFKTSLHLTSSASEGATRRHLWLCSVNNHANPPDHKWHSMRRKSSAKRKF